MLENKIQQALSCIDATDRELWLKIGMAIKSELGENGFYLFNDWSSTADNYKEADAKAVWKSIKPNGGVTIATLYHYAHQYGWQPDKKHSAPSPLELAQRQQQRIAEQAKQKAETQAKQKTAAAKARALWAGAKNANTKHSYLLTKKLPTTGLKQLGQALVVPLALDSEIVNLQFIQPDGQKRFLKDGQVKGAYCALAGNLERLYICEGWATGATIQKLTGYAVACAMSASNLLAVGLNLKRSKPNSQLIIAADNDAANKKNIGLELANAAAMQLGVQLVKPEFSPNEVGSDFNDRYLLDLAKELQYAG